MYMFHFLFRFFFLFSLFYFDIVSGSCINYHLYFSLKSGLQCIFSYSLCIITIPQCFFLSFSSLLCSQNLLQLLFLSSYDLTFYRHRRRRQQRLRCIYLIWNVGQTVAMNTTIYVYIYVSFVCTYKM